jgi:RimJ/RimL family protein N-acetyltransferase
MAASSEALRITRDEARFDPRPIVLEGEHVRLEPLAMKHADDLLAVGGDDETWLYMPIPALKTIEDARAMIREAEVEAREGREVPFAIVDRAARRVVGSTRYLDLQRPHRALEIGWTWVGAAWRRTAVNTECKLLLLRHAFEDLGAQRVTLKTDARNVRSQRAIERIGGVREGVLRRHRVCWDGSVRDTVYYGILDSEWRTVSGTVEEKRGFGPGIEPVEHRLHQRPDLIARDLRPGAALLDALEAGARQDRGARGEGDEPLGRPRALKREHVLVGAIEVRAGDVEDDGGVDPGGEVHPPLGGIRRAVLEDVHELQAPRRRSASAGVGAARPATARAGR